MIQFKKINKYRIKESKFRELTENSKIDEVLFCNPYMTSGFKESKFRTHGDKSQNLLVSVYIYIAQKKTVTWIFIQNYKSVNMIKHVYETIIWLKAHSRFICQIVGKK